MAGAIAVPLLATEAFAALAANALRGLTGLGAAVIFVPVASMAWSVAMALAVSAVLDLVGNSYLCWLNRATMKIPRAWWRVVCALTLGILIGSFFLTLDDKLVRRITGSVILLTLVIMVVLARSSLPTLPERFSTAVGFLAGLISPVSGVPGPAVALMLTLQGKHREIPKLTPPFLLINAIVRVIGLAALGRFDSGTMKAAIVLVPFGLMGVYGGQRFGRNIPFHQLRYLIVGVVAVSGVWMVAR
jgi:uncharacterized membrane protein YfcA